MATTIQTLCSLGDPQGVLMAEWGHGQAGVGLGGGFLLLERFSGSEMSRNASGIRGTSQKVLFKAQKFLREQSRP